MLNKALKQSHMQITQNLDPFLWPGLPLPKKFSYKKFYLT